MKLVLAAVLAMGLLALAGAARPSPTSPQSAASPPAPTLPDIDPAQFAVVKQIRATIEAKAAGTAGAAAAYTGAIPHTTVTYQMLPVPAGEFLMGSTGSEARKEEQPQHKVRLDAFWMQAREVSWDQFIMFMFADQANEVGKPDPLVDALSRPTSPHVDMSFGRGTQGFPAISMTQHAANKFAQWLSAKTGEFYRLPTEAEWEYACKAGTQTGLPEGDLEDYAWYAENSGTDNYPEGTYHPGGTKKPNAWGLHDMLGNVMEWTLDQFAPYTAGPAVNPWVKATKPYPHAVRGGSWGNDESGVTCSVRVGSDPSWKMQDPQLPRSVWYMTDAQWLGFRLVRTATLPSVEDMYRAWNSGVEYD
jgi:formylglycine-generating enzyme required for sulfatase activity